MDHSGYCPGASHSAEPGGAGISGPAGEEIDEGVFFRTEDEIKKEQIEMSKEVEKNHKVNMQKFSKLIELNEICDMTNQVFERRLSAIERKLNSIIEKKRVK